MPLPWIVLAGPTAVGKSPIAEEIAHTLKTDILVADSRQVYQGMDIGTNKPTQREQQRVLRHLIDLVPPETPFSAGRYVQEAEKIIAELEKMGKPVVIEGGTGLYIKALLYGLWKGPERNPELRKTLMALEQKEGEGTLYRQLGEVDPASAARMSFRDLSKIIRALEVFYGTGRPISAFHAEHRFQTKRSFQIFGFRRERSDLYRRIDARVEQQLDRGLIEETQQLLSHVSPQSPSMLALGYRQIVPYLQGKQTLDEAITLLARDTRHYAKRQITWFNADLNISWIDLKEEEQPHEIASQLIQNNKFFNP